MKRIALEIPMAGDPFWERVDVGGDTACWPWLGSRTKNGYGTCRAQGTRSTAHRRAWELANGTVPAGLFVLHRCDNPPCCNPAHLFVGTQQENVDDMWAKGRGAHGDRNGARRYPERMANHKNRPRGERVNTSKLTEDDVRAIRLRCPTARAAMRRVLAKEYGVSPCTIWNIVRRRSWRHVT